MFDLLLYNLRSGLRNILRLKSHTIISILGLVLGLCSFFIISAWTIQELMYDKFHKQHETIYMATTDIKGFEGDFYSYPETPPPLAEALEKQVPEIESGFHFIYLYGGRSLGRENNHFKETGIAVDSKFLKVLNFPLLAGDPKLLDEPHSIFLTEGLANKLFAEGDALGKSLTYKNEEALTVRGIIKNIPKNSSLQFDFLISYQIESENADTWWQLSDATFIKTTSSANISQIKTTAEKIWRDRIPDEQYNINFIPVKDLRYQAKFSFFNAEHGNIQKLYTFIFIALLILLLSCLNYINLISAYASKRTRDVMVRKVNGASSGMLVNYFLTESAILSLISWAFAALLSFSLLHLSGHALGIEIDQRYLTICVIAGFFIAFVVVGIISGLYPAIISSASVTFRAGIIFLKNYSYQQRLKNVFVLSQFVLSISLTIACLVIIRQNRFMSHFDVGYNKENIIQFLTNEDVPLNPVAVKEILPEIPAVEHITFARAAPVNLPPIFTTENWNWDGLDENAHTSFYRLNVDEEYLNVFQIPLLQGSFFSGSESDKNAIVINEKLGEVLGFEDPVGQLLRQEDQEFKIIGVVKDFHFQHLTNDIQPLLLMYQPNKYSMFVKVNGDIQSTLSQINEEYKKISDVPLLSSFVADSYDDMYLPEKKISRGIIVFTLLTIFLSSMGLVGLITFNTEIKTKEIAIRKVHGAKIREIAIVLNKGIAKWFAIAFVVSCCLTWVLMSKWLENYAFRTALDWWIFVSGATIILGLAILTISFQTWRAATKRPVEALKYE